MCTQVHTFTFFTQKHFWWVCLSLGYFVLFFCQTIEDSRYWINRHYWWCTDSCLIKLRINETSDLQPSHSLSLSISLSLSLGMHAYEVYDEKILNELPVYTFMNVIFVREISNLYRDTHTFVPRQYVYLSGTLGMQ